jgi:hypothetical protein
MSPDIEWQLDDEIGREVITRTPPPRPPARWRKYLITLTVMLGIGLGLIYSSIPEPPARPAPTETPQPTRRPLPTALPVAQPTTLIATIEREAQALAEGDKRSFMALQDPADSFWYQQQADSFHGWGIRAGRLFNIIDSGRLSDDRFWIDIRQYRQGRFFRETRFYRRVGDQWLRTQPDLAFWQGRTGNLVTPHFNVTFPVEDESLARFVADRFEQIYDRVCGLLDCTTRLDGTPAPSLTMTLQLETDIVRYAWQADDGQIEIGLSSPRLTGIYDSDRGDVTLSLNDDDEAFVYDRLIFLLTQHALSRSTDQRQALDVSWFGYAILDWAKLRLGLSVQSGPGPNPLAGLEPLSLDVLWTPQAIVNDQARSITWAESIALIRFVDQRYGSNQVPQLLKALRTAASLSQAVEAIGLSYPEFKQQWQLWLQQNNVALSQ